MNIAVVYESSFGNTRKIAEGVAEALRAEREDVVLLSVDEPLPPLDEIDLVVVGAPTHVHGLSSGKSRHAAIEQGAGQETEGIGVRGWLKELPRGDGRQAVAFDTRIRKPVLLTGSAAKGIARRLEHRGYELAVPPESFFVTSGAVSVLEEGELERAGAWARLLASRVRVPAGTAVS